MQSKYKQPASTAHCLTSAEELINRFYHHEMNVPDEVLDTYAAVLTTRIQESTEVTKLFTSFYYGALICGV